VLSQFRRRTARMVIRLLASELDALISVDTYAPVAEGLRFMHISLMMSGVYMET
jgi:hypothetical protein